MRSYTFNAGFNKPEVKAIIRKDATVNINCHQSFTVEELSQLIMFLQSIERLAETTTRITTSLLSKEEE
jgi:hypothetical protein